MFLLGSSIGGRKEQQRGEARSSGEKAARSTEKGEAGRGKEKQGKAGSSSKKAKSSCNQGESRLDKGASNGHGYKQATDLPRIFQSELQPELQFDSK